MDWEEYKKDWEQFRKIDTEQKLAHCKEQYSRHLLAIHDANFFEPSERNNPKPGITGVYYKNVSSIFGIKIDDPNMALYQVIPSFEPEYLLSIKREPGQYLLTYTVLVKNYWTLYYQNHEAASAGKTEICLPISSENGDWLFGLFERVIQEARVPAVGYLVLDGTQYFLSKIVDGVYKEVFKHSPGKDSKTRNVIRFLEGIIEHIIHGSEEALDAFVHDAINEMMVNGI